VPKAAPAALPPRQADISTIEGEGSVGEARAAWEQMRQQIGAVS